MWHINFSKRIWILILRCRTKSLSLGSLLRKIALSVVLGAAQQREQLLQQTDVGFVQQQVTFTHSAPYFDLSATRFPLIQAQMDPEVCP